MVFGSFLYYDSLPGRVSVPSSLVSLFIFYILSYLFSKMMGYFSGRLMSSASSQKLFCEVCSVFKCSFDEFVGEKVVSPSYSSAILAPPPSFNFSISPSSKYLRLVSFRIDWFDLLAVQGTLKNLLQHHSSKASILQHSAFFLVQLSHPYMTTGNLTDKESRKQSM